MDAHITNFWGVGATDINGVRLKDGPWGWMTKFSDGGEIVVADSEQTKKDYFSHACPINQNENPS